MAKQYEVVGACVAGVPVSTERGPMLTTVYKGAVLSDETVPADRIKHLLDVKLIKPLGKNEAPVQPEAEGGQQPKQDVDGRSSKAALVEHAVEQGKPREEAEAMTRDQLLDAYVRNK